MSVPVRGRRRQEGGEKVTGATRFTADLELPGLLHVHLVVAHTPRARIRGIETAAAAAADRAPEERPRNVTGVAHLKRGDVDAALQQADVVVRETYRLAGAHHSFLEPHVAIARPEPDGGLTIWSPTQGPFVVRGT